MQHLYCLSLCCLTQSFYNSTDVIELMLEHSGDGVIGSNVIGACLSYKL